MKKQRNNYRFSRYEGQALKAQREISYEIKLSSRLILDELCFKWNKQRLLAAINQSIDTSNEEDFLKLSKVYQLYIQQ